MTFTDAWGEEIDPFYRTKHQLETMGATRPKPVEKVGAFVIRARVNDKGEVIGYVAASDRTGQWMDYYLLDTTIDLANFRKNVARFASSKLMGRIEQTQQKPEWMREFAYSAVMFWRGHLKETMRSVGRQWISALEDPLWWMSAAPATLTPFVGPASVGGAVIDGEGGEIRPVANPAGEAPATSDVAAEGSAPQSPGNSPRVSEGAGSSREYISNETTAEASIRWVDEGGDMRAAKSAGMSDEAYAYQSSTPGARSNAIAGRSQAPEVQYVDANGNEAKVKFDGIEGNKLVDRKLGVHMGSKTRLLAERQSAALAQNGLEGVWEVPDATEAARARKLFAQEGIRNIRVEVVKR